MARAPDAAEHQRTRRPVAGAETPAASETSRPPAGEAGATAPDPFSTKPRETKLRELKPQETRPQETRPHETRPPPAARRGAVTRAQRRRAILDAALTVFAQNGFSGARLDDVAARAGVAKGTLYLYFADKEALFRGLVEDSISPVLGEAGGLVAAFPGTTRDLLDLLLDLIADRILDHSPAVVVRLMLAEGARFPELAAYYHREVVARGLALIRQVARRGLDRGELDCDAAARFPQLVVAPALLCMQWNALFGAVEPLDSRKFLAAHRDLLLRGLGWRDP